MVSRRLPSSKAVATGACLVLFLCPTLAGAAPHPDEKDVRRQLQDILSRPEFGADLEGANWLQRLIVDFLAWLASLHVDAPALFWVLVFLCLAVLSAVALFVFSRLRRLFFVGDLERRRRHEEARRRAEMSKTYRAEARERAGRGEFTEAIRYLFLSLVYQFDESGRVLFPRAFTNREYLRLFEDRPQIESELRVFVDTLDDHWYGLRPAGEDQYRRCLGLYDHLAGRP
jgi:Domain of unknown function (DUF4129)